VIRAALGSLRRRLASDRAYTAPDAANPRLRGRTYAIPFEAVWQASLDLMKGGLRGWNVLEADDEEGVMEGAVQGWFQRFDSGVTVRISLDRDAQTRVDAVSATIAGRADMGTNARRLTRFFRALDQSLEQARGRPISSAQIEPAPWK
jgi:hypothetical protein